MTKQIRNQTPSPVQCLNTTGTSSVVLVCEHASHFIPPSLHALGLAPDVRKSHAVWDPGAMGVATHLAKRLDASLIAGGISRLVYDCNRPPCAPDAMPERSEVIDIPGNKDLSEKDRAQRIAQIYEPFRKALSAQIAQTNQPVIVTIHSFTPTYFGRSRDVEIGLIHDHDTTLTNAMLDVAAQHTQANVQRNQPYKAENGVAHTLKEHATSGGYLNVMLEIRNDLIATQDQQIEIAHMLANWIVDAFAQTGATGDVQCKT